jgi:hypothetical protein
LKLNLWFNFIRVSPEIFKLNPIKIAFDAVGGRTKAASLLNRSYMAMSKMEKRGLLPRTEYTGETNYAEVLAANSAGKFTAEWLKDKARP